MHNRDLLLTTEPHLGPGKVVESSAEFYFREQPRTNFSASAEEIRDALPRFVLANMAGRRKDQKSTDSRDGSKFLAGTIIHPALVHPSLHHSPRNHQQQGEGAQGAVGRMDIAHPIHTEVTSLAFSYLTSQDIRAISVKKIDNPLLMDSLNLPNKGGLYDAALGPSNPRDVCVPSHTAHQR